MYICLLKQESHKLVFWVQDVKRALATEKVGIANLRHVLGQALQETERLFNKPCLLKQLQEVSRPPETSWKMPSTTRELLWPNHQNR